MLSIKIWPPYTTDYFFHPATWCPRLISRRKGFLWKFMFVKVFTLVPPTALLQGRPAYPGTFPPPWPLKNIILLMRLFLVIWLFIVIVSILTHKYIDHLTSSFLSSEYCFILNVYSYYQLIFCPSWISMLR